MRKSGRNKKLLMSAVFFMATISLLIGCSGGSSSTLAPPPACTAPATPGGVSATKIVSASVGNDATASGTCVAFKTITAALAVSSSGDAVWVAPGTYDTANGEVFPISVPAGVSLIGDVASKGTGTTPTLIKGHGTVGITGYSAALVTGATTTISGCGFDDSAFTTLSFGIYSNNVTFSASDNTFLSNSLYGGIYLQNGGNPSITNNTFQSNSYGVLSTCTGTATIQGNTFTGISYAISTASGNTVIQNNTITSPGGNCGIQVQNGAPSIQNNTFSSTGLVYAELCSDGSPIVRNNTFSGTGPAVQTRFTAAPDLGTSISPGANIFSSVTGTVIDHGSSATIFAIGNTWPTTPPVCGSQIVASGTGTVVWGPGGTNHCP
jgi:parallel beta-helix repeat protein